MKVLFFGDVVGRPGREAVAAALPKWRDEHQPDMVVANAENSAHGSGATPATLDELRKAGVEAFTFGDHYRFTDWSKLKDYPIVRPANADIPEGFGSRIIESALGKRLLLINLLGFAFLKAAGSNYFEAVDREIEKHANKKPDGILIDFHAETTAETLVLGDYVDGRASALVGTHTHIPTADTRLLPKGTAYQTDVGMCGVLNSSIGVTYESARSWLQSELSGGARKIPKTQAEDPPFICDAVLIETDGPTKSKSIKRLTTRP